MGPAIEVGTGVRGVVGGLGDGAGAIVLGFPMEFPGSIAVSDAADHPGRFVHRCVWSFVSGGVVCGVVALRGGGGVTTFIAKSAAMDGRGDRSVARINGRGCFRFSA